MMRHVIPLFLLFSTANAFSSIRQTHSSFTVTPRIIAPSSSSSLSLHTPKPTTTSATRSIRPTSLHATPTTATKQQPRDFPYKKRCATLFAFLTGYADYLLFIKYRFFSTMMTGNSMWMACAFVEGRYRDVAFYLSVIASYIFGVGLFRRVELEWREDALNGILAPMVAGLLVGSDLLTRRDAACRWVPGVMLAFAWGIINSVGSQVTGTLIFVVTGAMTRISNMLVDRISSTAGNTSISKEGLLMSLSVILGFTLGAGWSVFVNGVAPNLKSFGSFSILGLIYGALFVWLDRKQLGAWWLKKNGKLCDIDGEEVDCK